jgi:hypothetical protein
MEIDGKAKVNFSSLSGIRKRRVVRSTTRETTLVPIKQETGQDLEPFSMLWRRQEYLIISVIEP